MENPDKRLSELVDIVKSWIPRRSEPANVSRDFWMPDHSCRVCYECDSQFTIFNRRHHCRQCGRVFCAKCTANSIPTPSDDQEGLREEGERIRVCNYCFKQWEQDIAADDNGNRVASPGLSPSLSATSLVSTKSSGTVNGSSTTAGSMSYSTVPYQRMSYGSGLSPSHSVRVEPSPDKMDMLTSDRNMDSIVNIGEASPNQFEFCLNRSDIDDEEDQYSACRSDSEIQQFHQSDDYYVRPVEFDEVDHGYGSQKVYPAQENNTPEDVSSPRNERREYQTSLSADKMAEGARHDNMYDCDASSSIYNMEVTDAEPVDFENNAALWLPPAPEDEEDEREVSMFDDDDDEDASGEWGYLRSSNSFGSGEFRSRDRSSEEHRKAMKNVVDGHFRALVSQLLQVEKLPMGEEDGKESWLEIITSLSWEAATLLKPDTSKGGGMDPGGYVKIKCVACGHRSECMVVKGIVCKKNVAHRRMTSRIEKPRLLILGGALEYQRKANLLSSFDTLLQQEMDHLKMAVAKIDAQHPNVLLVEKSVSRFAQDYLLAKDISLVLNMKRALLDRIARCTAAQIVPSIDHLSSQKLGHCDLFHVEKFFEEHGSAGQGGKKLVKTLMFFEGCPKPLGCTILLKGASGDELKKVKHVVQYGVFAAYHLALETSFLADEGASLPELPLKSPITVALLEKSSNMDRYISTIPGFSVPTSGGPQLSSNLHRVSKVSNSDPSLLSVNIRRLEPLTSLFYSGKYLQITETPKSSISPPVDYKELRPEESFQAEYVAETQVSAPFPYFSLSGNTVFDPYSFPPCASKEKGKMDFGENFEVEIPRANRQIVVDDHIGPGNHLYTSEASEKDSFMSNGTIIDGQHVVGKQLVYSHSGTLHQNSNLEEHTLEEEEFPPSPSDHQSILVSLSTRCVWKGTVCERAHLFRIKYYGSFDKPLGRFLRDHLFDQGYQCRSCEMPSEAHVHCYTHRQGSLTISVKKLSCPPLPGERDGKIWMWHRCLCCPRIDKIPPATRRVVMSDAAWGLSFGKFLELSFSNHAAASRVATCGHSLHRDCLRFYGFGNMVACFRYASIDVHSVYLPPPKLDFNYQHQAWIQKEADEVADRAEILFSDVLNALRQVAEKRPSSGLGNSSVRLFESRRYIVEFEGILQKEKMEFEESLQNVVNKDVTKGQPIIDILEINKLRRQLLFHSYLWDRCLIYAAGLDKNSQEGHSGLTNKTKEKLSSIEKPVELNAAPKPQRNFASCISLPLDLKTDEFLNGNLYLIDQEDATYDHPNTNQPILGPESREMEQNLSHGKQSQRSPSYSIMDVSNKLDPLEYGVVVRRALSDGQFPVVANLSDTLDAKWTGENCPAVSEMSTPDSSVALENAAGPSESDHSEDQGGIDLNRSFTIGLPIKGADCVVDFSSWIEMPFLSFYRFFNTNSCDGLPRFYALNEYNPVYVSSFWELEHQGGARLLLPIGVNDTIIPVYDDEPTSIISYALVSSDYHSQISDERERIRDSGDSSVSLPFYDSGFFHPFTSFDDMSSESLRSTGSVDESFLSMSGSRSSVALDPLLLTKALHVRVSFSEEGPLGKVKYTVTCYHAKQFDVLRRICCPSELDFIRSLSRCKKWGAQGGKSNVFFAKSLDDRFIIKQVTKTELESFIKFAPDYFKYLSESISTGSPTCLAKILGIYQVSSKHMKGGKESKMDVLVMENLLFRRSVTKLYDLKGSSRSRYNADSSGNNKVLLDQNLIEAMPTSPIFVGNKAKRLLERAVWNDTAFLASIDVMDYSLLVGIDEEKHELVLGIIDFMRQYTWDKHLETWVKASGILGGPKNESPTVVSPKQYKKRFRKAMTAYFLMVPDQWSPPTIILSRSQSDLGEDSLQDHSLGS